MEAKKKGKLFSSEMEVPTDDTREDQLHKNGDVWENNSLLGLFQKEGFGFPPDRSSGHDA